MARPGPIDLDLSSRAVIEACPEAFIAIDADGWVVMWNAAAERLTGFTSEQALGGPLPHLTAAQWNSLRERLPAFDDWAGDVPTMLPCRHADGSMITTTVTRFLRLHDAAGQPAGYGCFLRPVRASDTGARVRNALSRGLAASVRPEDAMDALADAIRDLLPGDRGYLLRREAGIWRGWLAAGDHREVAEGISVTDPGPLDRAVREGTCGSTTLRIRDEPTDVLLVGAGPDEPDVLLVLVADARADDAAEIRFDAANRELAVAVASEVWATLRRLLAVDDLEGKVEILEAMAAVSAAAGLDSPTVAAHIARHAAEALSCERAALYLHDQQSGQLQVLAFHATDRDWTLSDSAIQQAGRDAAARIAAEGGRFLTQDASSCAWLAGPWHRDEGAVSVHAMPLRLAEEDLGILVVAHTEANPRGFTSLCTQVGAALSRQASLAMANARLYEAEREAAERFRDVDRQRADYIAGITHDLRSPVTAVLGFARTLSQSGDLLTMQDRVQALATIERQSLRMSRMLDDMLDSARAEAGELAPDQRLAVPLHVVVRDAMAIAGPEQLQRLELDVDEGVTVCGDADQLTRVVQNLIGNALQYARLATAVRIRVAMSGGEGLVSVIDHGPGLPEGFDVFARFGRGDGHGTGLGLYTVKRIVELHDGSIDVTDTPGGGTTITVRLPRYDTDGRC